MAYPLIAYFAGGATLYFEQGSLLFPAPKTVAKLTPADAGLRFEDLRIPVNAEDHLHGWWIPAEASSESVILAFHGNGYTLEDMAAGETGDLHEIGANLLLVDYRGYGTSSATSPSEATVNEDAKAALAWLLRRHGTPVGCVFLLGRSIGSGPATYLASTTPGLAGVILESPLSSIDDAANRFWFARIYPTGLMLHTHFDNLSRIGSVRAPLLIVSGTADTLTPPWMARALFARAGGPKQLHLVPGASHNDLLEVGGAALARALRTFVAAGGRRLTTPARLARTGAVPPAWW